LKSIKLSLIAIIVIISSAYAIENTKLSGETKFYYGTQDTNLASAPDIFNKDASYANFAVHLGLTSNLSHGISAGIGLQAVSTLGLENNIASLVWSGSNTSTGSTTNNTSQYDTAMWMDEAWLAGTAFDTTLKIGRQTIDTPFVFTENWGIDKNTFEAIVLINQSILDTNLIISYIGKSNGSADNLNAQAISKAAYVSADGKFNTIGADGMYTFGLVNNFFKALTFQAWYYDVTRMAEAYWLQADLKIGGILAGIQYANIEPDGGSKDTDAYAFMLGYDMQDLMTIKLSYSDVDDDGSLGVANIATGSSVTLGGQSKLYTEMWWYGNVSAVGAETFSLTADTNIFDIDCFFGYVDTEIDPRFGLDREIKEYTLSTYKSFGPLHSSLAIIYYKAKIKYLTFSTNYDSTDVQLYLTYDF